MRLSKKIITVLLAVLILTVFVPHALAVSDTDAEAGKSVTVTFTFADVYNVDGIFEIGDPQNVLSTYSINVLNAGATAALVNGDRLWASPLGEPVKTTVSIGVVLNIKSTAPAGAQCTVSFTGIYGDANQAPGNECDITKTATVTVKAAAVTPTPTPTPSTTPAVTPTPTPTPSTTPAVTPTPSTTPTQTPTPAVSPTPGEPGVDYTELEKQIAVASGLKMSDYTEQSRGVLDAALAAAQNARSSKEQSDVTAAAEELRTAITGLVSMDYSQLKAALDRADTLLESEQAAVLWEQLSETAEQGRLLLQSGDQQAVDQAAGQLTDLLNDIAALLEAEPETKVVVQEVPVEVLPSGDYCNVEQHHLWPVLFAVSAVLNLGLIGVIAAYIVRRTKNRRDVTPLVDYDIDDDI